MTDLASLSASAEIIPRRTWPDTVRRMDWRQSEHVTLIGPNGRGKTELTLQLLQDSRRRWVMFLGTKRRDSTQDRLKGMGYRTVPDPEQINPEVASKYVLRPPFPRNADADELLRTHRDVFRRGLMLAYHTGGWCVVMDEGRYITDFLGLKHEANLLWLQGRSQKNAVVCGTQRARFIPLEAYDQAVHLFLWTDPDRGNVRRNAELAGFNGDLAMAAMRRMTKHDVLYVETTTGDMWITNTRWR